MIPKIIHYTWFSGEDFPEKIKHCIDSWNEFLPDYEFRLWGAHSIKNIDSQFLTEAIKCKKWAYASDFVRLYAVYNFGGIYLDTDVMLYNDFDSVLDNKVFIGRENSIHFEGRRNENYLTSHCFGAEKGNQYIKHCLDYYTDRHFECSINNDLPNTLRFNMVLLPYIQCEIAKLYGFDSRPSQNKTQYCKDGMVIYPISYFDAPTTTKQTICRHLAMGSWREYRSQDENATLSYKLRWRWERLVHRLLGSKYVIIRLN